MGFAHAFAILLDQTDRPPFFGRGCSVYLVDPLEDHSSGRNSRPFLGVVPSPWLSHSRRGAEIQDKTYATPRFSLYLAQIVAC